MGKFVITKTKGGEFTFDLKAGNGEVILTASESYTSMSGCQGGIASVQKNALAHVEDQTVEGFEKLTHPKFEVYQDKAGEFRFRLKGYKRKDSCLNGIASVGKNAPDAKIEEPEGDE